MSKLHLFSGRPAIEGDDGWVIVVDDDDGDVAGVNKAIECPIIGDIYWFITSSSPLIGLISAKMRISEYPHGYVFMANVKRDYFSHVFLFWYTLIGLDLWGV